MRLPRLLLFALAFMAPAHVLRAATWAFNLENETWNYATALASERLAAATPDGGFVVLSSAPASAMKVDANGGVSWHHRYDAQGMTAVTVASDGRILVAGFGTVAGARRNLLTVLGPAGNLLSSQVISCPGPGTMPLDHFSDLRRTADGGFILAGITRCAGSATDDIWLIKLDAALAIVWQKAYDIELNSARGDESWVRVVQKLDGSYFVVATTYVVLPTSGPHPLVLQVDAAGTPVRADAYACGSFCPAYVVDTADLLANGDLVIAGPGGSPFVAVFDSGGTLRWQKSYQAPSINDVHALAATPDGGFVFGGSTLGGVSFEQDALLAKLDANGVPQLVRSFSGEPLLPQAPEFAASVLPTADGGYLATVYRAGTSTLMAIRTDAQMDLGAACPLDAPVTLQEWNFFALEVPSLRPTATARVTAATLGTPDPQVDPIVQANRFCGSPSSCATSALPVARLLGAKNGAHVDLSWQADPVANGYNLWYVDDKLAIPQARLGGVPAPSAVAGCRPTAPGVTTCTDLDAVPRQSPTTFFYQARVSCDPTTEGP